MYIKVRTKSGAAKQVRYYTEAEYNKMYKIAATAKTPAAARYDAKSALGFSEGPITIFRGDTYSHLEWFQQSCARYCKWWGWYVVSTDEVPADLPEDVEPIKLEWAQVSADGINLNPETAIKPVIDALLFPPEDREYIAEPNDRVEVHVHIDYVNEYDNAYGLSYYHVMTDDEGNHFTWTTATRKLRADAWYVLKATVKELKVIKGKPTHVLTRAKIISEE